MSKWKLEIKAPFLGIAPDSHRNITNDYWGTYGEPNQAQTALGALFDCSNPNYLAPSPKQYNVTGASSTDLIKYISDYTIPENYNLLSSYHCRIIRNRHNESNAILQPQMWGI